ncbi:MAG: Maf family protein [Gammaproteobacteria bacterium]
MPTILYLASQSFRRRQLLSELGIQFELLENSIDESRKENEPPKVMAGRLATEKATSAWPKALQVHQGDSREAILLAADTLVDLDGEPIGKPDGHEEAREILQRLCKTPHLIHTAIAVLNVSQGLSSLTLETSTTRVFMKEPAPGWVDYCASVPEALNCAGGYAIQGAAGPLVERIEGCFYTVVGLPLAKSCTLLQSFGVPILKSI